MISISLTIKAKKSLLERYFADGVDFAKIEAAEEEEVEINICSGSYVVDIAEKMIEENLENGTERTVPAFRLPQSKTP